ncbi:MAG: radical SAM/Cys-rich domain protein [bacterium]|nr:MAG: radical SAM/Cys-rich domain protein [bacterium]
MEREIENLTPFDDMLKGSGLFPLEAQSISVFQMNLGKRCNQTCKHCHVEAGPHRTEMMDDETLDACMDILSKTDIPTVDITGGAPEMHPRYRELVENCRHAGKTVTTRCNLTILAEEGYENFVEFFKEQNVTVMASLPYYREAETDSVRGAGVFEKSVSALRSLNDAGYGREGTGLVLNLVYNPAGAYMPPPQRPLENDFKRELAKRYALVFNNLLTMVNMPIARFRDFLIRTKNYRPYVNGLVKAYNPAAAEGVMCRTTLSIGWNGVMYDCDFNQMLGIRLNHSAQSHILDFDTKELSKRRIMTRQHCYGCTAGCGSSCTGATT